MGLATELLEFFRSTRGRDPARRLDMIEEKLAFLAGMEAGGTPTGAGGWPGGEAVGGSGGIGAGLLGSAGGGGGNAGGGGGGGDALMFPAGSLGGAGGIGGGDQNAKAEGSDA